MMIGQFIGHYRVTGKLGAGGMGEVYRATDTKLGRDVAIKVLPNALAADPQRMQRFQREAQVLAALNHPHIATIHGLEESGATRALVMELVEGPTLAERITRGPLPLDEALPIAKQIAEALEYAHEHGIIHRDLKPANIKLTPDGAVKVLDFGLAKAMQDDPTSGLDLANSPTLSLAATKAGVILGTAAYMSPEQAKGKPVDRRADIWAFGVVLYEMLTGRTLFAGETASETMAAVIMKEPALEALPAAVPPHIRHLLVRCLRKDPKSRLRDIGDARVAIEEAAHPEAAGATASTGLAVAATTTPAWLRVLPWALAGLLAVAFGASLWRGSDRPAPSPTPARFTIPLSQNEALEVLSLATFPAVAISPDGTKLVYAARREGLVRLFLRPLDSPQAGPIPGTENASAPFFSPDGNWVAFFADGKLKKIPLGGGPVVTLASVADHRGGTWAGDTIVYSPDAVAGLFRIPANGGPPQPLTQLDASRGERTHRFPRFLPDGQTVLFTVGTQASPDYYDNARIDAVRLGTGERRTAMEGASTAAYVPSGHLVFSREGSLFAQPYDPQHLQPMGPSVTVLQGVRGDMTTGAVHFSVSANGSLFYVPGVQAGGDILTRMDRSGKATALPAPERTYLELSLSPDGQRAAITIGAINDYDIWIYDVARGTLSRLTFGGVNRSPKWSADGTRVVYATVVSRGVVAQTAETAIYSKAADGSGPQTLLRKLVLPDGSRSFVDDVSPDGKWISIVHGSALGDISLMPADGQGDLTPFAATEFDETSSAFSPDGRWIAYTSRESGRMEVYVRAVSGPGGKWQVSTSGGETPRWSRNGKELFYHAGNRMMVAPVQISPVFQAGTPQVLFDNYFDLRTDAGAIYDVGPDAKWFLAVRPSSEQAQDRELHLTLNWFEELKRLAPTTK